MKLPAASPPPASQCSRRFWLETATLMKKHSSSHLSAFLLQIPYHCGSRPHPSRHHVRGIGSRAKPAGIHSTNHISTLNHHNAPFGRNHISWSHSDLHLGRFLNDHQILSAALLLSSLSVSLPSHLQDETSRHRYHCLLISSIKS